MNSFDKIAVIINLITEIGDCDELRFSLDEVIRNLTQLKSVIKPKVITPSLCQECDLIAETEDEEEDDLEPCKCHSNMDIRGRCDPVRSAPSFAKCRARVDTTLFHIQNDYEFHKDIEGLCRKSIHERYKEYASVEPYCLTSDEQHELIELLEQDEEENEEYQCCKCNTFIPLAKEPDTFTDDEDRLICQKCSVDYVCNYCCEYHNDTDDLESLNEYNNEKFCKDCIALKWREIINKKLEGLDYEKLKQIMKLIE
jgi:hypothetical protein